MYQRFQRTERAYNLQLIHNPSKFPHCGSSWPPFLLGPQAILGLSGRPSFTTTRTNLTLRSLGKDPIASSGYIAAGCMTYCSAYSELVNR